MANKEEQIQWAKLAEQTERYHDMAIAMKKAAEIDGELTNVERNLFSMAYKNVVSNYRSSWRAMSTIEEKAKGAEHKHKMTKEYREKIESELKAVCHEVLVRVKFVKYIFHQKRKIFLDLAGQIYHSESNNNGIKSILFKNEG